MKRARRKQPLPRLTLRRVLPPAGLFGAWVVLVSLADHGRFESGAVLEGIYFTADGRVSEASSPRAFERLVRWFDRESPSCFLLSSARNPLTADQLAIRGAIRQVSAAQGVDEDLAHAIIFVESRCRPEARSPRGAIGLMQVMPTTAKEVGISNPGIPVRNVEAGIRYVSGLQRRFAGSLLKTLSAYNAGPGAVSRYSGVPPYPETRAYVARVLAAYSILRERRRGAGQRSSFVRA